MADIIPAYPLAWPAGWRRTESDGRRRAKFGKKKQGAQYSYSSKHSLSIGESVTRLMETFERMGVDTRDDVVVSTDLVLRLDGLPRSSQAEPNDPGACAYWLEASGERRCMAIDQYDRIADNIAAVAATLEAMRAIERHGGAEILNRAFTGFVALPAPAQWWHVLDYDSAEGLELHEVEFRFKQLAMQRHPDRGGSIDEMRELVWARETAREQLPSL